jgi:TRAP-type C4-dicarboxylate transport system permease small subunit
MESAGLQVLDRILDVLIKTCAVLACAILAIMTVLITVEVMLRFLFRTSMYFTDEYSGYMVLAVMALGIAYCREKNALLTVDFLVERLDARIRARLVLAYGVASLAFCILLDIYLARLVFQSIERNITAPTMTGTPLWIPQLLLPVGITLLVLVVARKLIRPDPFGEAVADQRARE